jgi:lipopolysaccharide transport system ATP-binding protein
MAILELDDVGLVYPLIEGSAISIRRKLLSVMGIAQKGSAISYVTGLRNLSLKFERGERVGLIGRNGAGKSTFLRLLAGIYVPSSGTIKVEGEATTLFDLSLGMDDEATGYDNIYIAGYVLGFSKREIQSRISEIEVFTELGDALNRPIKTYSAGMRVRLAFALATTKASDILLVDEIIGVGDSQFLAKAQRRVKSLMRDESIFFLASHAEFMLNDFCERGLVFDSGRVVFDGPIDLAIAFYNGAQSASA